MNPADPFGLIGQVLDGQFRVDKFVGEGGFSFVYRGHHAGLNEPIAIKCLKLPPAIGSALVESFIRRFRDESRIHYRLSQGNLAIARSIASGTTMSSTTSALVPYMVLEWLDGRSLAQDFDVRRERGMTGRTMEETVRLLDSAAQGLAFAHAQGVVHRDMNPGNLFLAERQQSPDGTMTKVLDFGVAKVISDHALEMGPRAHTLGQIRIFAPAYGSPEQFDDGVGKVGPQSDVYSFSLIVLEALRDLPVRDGEHLGEFALMALDANTRPTPRSLGVPVGDNVEDLFRRAGALRPEERPSDMGQFWGGLKNAIRTDAQSGKAPYADAPPSRPWKPKPPAAGQSLADRPVTADMPASPIVEVARPGSFAPPAPDPMRSNMLHGTIRIEPPAAAASASPRPSQPKANPLTSTLVMSSPVPPPAQPQAPAPVNPLNATVALASPFGRGQDVPGMMPARPQPAPVPLGTMVMEPTSPAIGGARGFGPENGSSTVGHTDVGAAFAAARAQADAASTYPSAQNMPLPPMRAEMPTEITRRPSQTGKLIVLLSIALVLVGGLGAFAYVRITAAGTAPASSASAAPSASASAPPLAVAAPSAVPTQTAAAPTAPLPPEEAPAATATATVAPEEPAPTPRESSGGRAASAPPSESFGSEPAVRRTAAPSSGTTPPPSTAATHAAATPAPASGGSGGFDVATARAGLDVMNGVLASCRNPGGKTGEGKVNVTFGTDGHVERASVDDPPFAGTQEGTCAASLFKRTKIAPFTGGPGTIVYTFRIPK